MSEIDFRGRYGSAGSKEVYFARIRKGLGFEKASFGGDRSAAGRYAANERWKGNAKDDISNQVTVGFESERKDRGTVWATDKATGKVVGALKFDANFIGKIYVAKDYRRKGIGSFLYNEAKKRNGGVEMKADDYTVSGAGFMSAVTGKEVYQTGDNSWAGIEWKSWLERLERDALEKASFGGDRSAAGRYAAEQRWKGHKKDVTEPKQARDLREELKGYFGTTVKQYLKSDGYKDVQQKLIDKQSIATGVGDLQLEVIADKQGFSGLPSVVSSDEMDQLEKQGWTIAYRGIADDYEDDILANPAEKLAEQFRTGEYFAGLGTSGNGIYFAKDEMVAERYAGNTTTKTLGGVTYSVKSDIAKGTVIKVAIPPNALMTENDFKYELGKLRDLQKGAYYDGEWYGDDDIGRNLAAKGVRGAEISLSLGLGNTATGSKAIIIYDRSMLAVEESRKTK